MIYQTINRKKILKWACSSMVERYVDIVEAISSILITPTILRKFKLCLVTLFQKHSYIFSLT